MIGCGRLQCIFGGSFRLSIYIGIYVVYSEDTDYQYDDWQYWFDKGVHIVYLVWNDQVEV